MAGDGTTQETATYSFVCFIDDLSVYGASQAALSGSIKNAEAVL